MRNRKQVNTSQPKMVKCTNILTGKWKPKYGEKKEWKKKKRERERAADRRAFCKLTLRITLLANIPQSCSTCSTKRCELFFLLQCKQQQTKKNTHKMKWNKNKNPRKKLEKKWKKNLVSFSLVFWKFSCDLAPAAKVKYRFHFVLLHVCQL